MRLRLVWDASKAAPIEGSATLATARFRLATPATRISANSAAPAFAGSVDACAGGASAIQVPPNPGARGACRHRYGAERIWQPGAGRRSADRAAVDVGREV